jgi:phosphatidylserine/phosphatidylglycerophosphate/cardiolipin synthase-like enzyme
MGMNYRRLLLLTKIGGDPRPAFAALKRLVPSPDRMTVVAQQPTAQFAWMALTGPPEYSEATAAAVDALHREARQAAVDVDVRLVSELTLDALTDLIASTGTDLVALDSTTPGLRLAAQLRKRSPVALLYLPQIPPPRDRAGGLLCVALSARERWAIAAFLKAHAGADDRAVLLSRTPLTEEDVRQIREVAGVTPAVQLAASEGTLRQLLAGDLGATADLIVLPRFAPLFLLTRGGLPVLVLPSLRPTGTEWERSLDVPDLVDDGRLIRVRAEYAVGIGRRTPISDQQLAFVGHGSVVARSISRDGTCELPTGLGDSLGVYRCDEQDAADVMSSIDAPVSVLRAGPRPRVLFDAELDDAGLRAVRSATWADPVGVRVRSTRSCRSLRARLRGVGLPAIVIDTGTVLDEGDAHDISPILDAVRLARTAARLRACGFHVPAIVYRGAHRPSTVGFAALQPQELSTFPPSDADDASGGAPLASPLDATTGSEVIAGNRIEVELDNPTARNWLLRAIESSQQRVHFQVYMALDDDVGRPVEAALAAAAERGVAVRVLVDSLHGLHGSFGLHNPILDRLSSRPGVEFRAGSPITGEPSLEDLKQRDHRKLVVVDGRVALVGGRNLSHEYYTGFEEVPLHPEMTWRMVPWLDAGARVEGPAVAALDRSFLQAWTDAGGGPFDIAASPPVGTAAARVIVHRGLRDAYTVDAYIALIDAARSHVCVVNGFPLLLEIQHALLRALRRGVRVRTLVGNLTPLHGDVPFAGPWASGRTVATSFVHSRMDPIVAAGGECYELVVPHQHHWHPSVGDVRPHVHAKAMSVDGRVCAVGSANLDVTAGYWESELLLVVEDAAIATSVEARFDELFATSLRVDPEDPDWKRRAELRRWMRYWPGMLSA